MSVPKIAALKGISTMSERIYTYAHAAALATAPPPAALAAALAAASLVMPYNPAPAEVQ